MVVDREVEIAGIDSSVVFVDSSSGSVAAAFEASPAAWHEWPVALAEAAETSCWVTQCMLGVWEVTSETDRSRVVASVLAMVTRIEAVEPEPVGSRSVGLATGRTHLT